MSDDLVLRTGRATYVVEMRTWPPTLILDPAGNTDPIGWGTGRATWVTGIDFHPHEDPGNRSWHIDDIKLLRNEPVKPGVRAYDIVFVDDAWAPGTTADIVADPNLNPNDAAQRVIARGPPGGRGPEPVPLERHRRRSRHLPPAGHPASRRRGGAPATPSVRSTSHPTESAWPPVVK